MNILESIFNAFDSIRTNKLRAFLTLLSIAIGVFAIMGAGSLVSSFNNAITGQLAEMGENTILITQMPSMDMGHNWRKYRNRKPVTYSQVKDFKKNFSMRDNVSCEGVSTGHTVKYLDNTTDPDVLILGTDEVYFYNNGVKISRGRAFTAEDILLNTNIAIIGNDVIVKTFPNIDPIGKKIRIKNQSFYVVGILETKGAVLGQSQDNKVIVPITQFLKYYAWEWEESLRMTIKAQDKTSRESTMDEAIGVMRNVRNDKPWQENTFEITTNEAISEQFASFTSYIEGFGSISGGIALLAACVGIMNIMIVSVKERTREIGVRKAVGAKNRWILYQIIIETITLCQIGGWIGILLGIACSWGLGALAHFEMIFPTAMVIKSIGICTVLGIISGAYPAWRAAKLDPIDALRYE